MAIDGLTIIGESINDSVPSTKKLFDANDLDAIKQLAVTQDEGGAAFIDVNVGARSAEYLADVVRMVQSVTAKPLSIDTPDPAMVAAALDAYDADRAGGQAPIINSISPLRTQIFDLLKVKPFMPILLVSERMEGGSGQPNHTVEETYRTACDMHKLATERGLKNGQMIFDLGIAPIGSDSEGNIHRLLGALKQMHEDSRFNGVHYSVGLSNFTVMLPPKRGNGQPTKGPLESAFLTMAMPLGLDMVIGSVKRKYELLPPDHDAMVCLSDILKLEGFDVLMRVQEYYA